MGYFVVEGEDEKGKFRKLVDDETGVVASVKYLVEYYLEDGNGLHEVDHSDKTSERMNQPWFFRIYRTNWVDLVRKKKLTPYEFGVLVMMMSFLDWESNYIVDPKTKELLSLSKLAELLQMNRDQLDRTIKTLHDRGLVSITTSGKGRSKIFQLNSHVLFYGSQFRDLNEHKVFDADRCAYEPVVRKRYKQRTDK